MSEKPKLYDYQEEGVRMELAMKRCINGDDMGTGKQQSVDCVVKTPHGDKRIGDVSVGDIVFGRDGKPHIVTGVFPQGVKPIYRVVFSDGVSTEAGMEHLWTVRDNNRRRRGSSWTVKTTAQLLSSGLFRKENKWTIDNGAPPCKWEIPMCEAVEYNEKDFLIHPYILGVLLGDGALKSGAVFSNPDIDGDIYERVKELLPDGYYVREDRYASCPRYRIVHPKTHENPFIDDIRLLGLNVIGKDKFIPVDYLFGSVEQRKELLSGLMDTDGSVVNHSRVGYSTTSKQLAIDVQTLVQSLGGQAIIKKYERKRMGKIKVEYSVNVRTPFNPFFTSRKHSSYRIKSKVFPVRKIKSVEYVGNKEAVCIMVDNPDHTYLTDSFIVTHNTIQSIVAIERAKATPCLVICPSALKVNWEREIKRFTNLRPLILTDSVNATFGYHLTKMNLFDVVICNYESLQKYFIVDLGAKPLRLKNFVFRDEVSILKSVIIDESARVKDPSTRQSKIIMGICKGKEYIYELTGTPIVNHATDLACQIAILGRMNEMFGNYGEFMNRYGENNNLEELNQKIHSCCYFRREKKDVLKDLPELTRTTIGVGLDVETQKEYDTCQHDLLSFLLEYKNCTEAEARKKLRMKALVQFMNLRSISGKGKMKATIEFLHDTEERIIVFAEHRDVVAAIKEEFPDEVCTVTGSDNQQQKQWAVDSFQAHRKRIIVCSIKAAGVGLTLTASSNVLFTEMPWTFADLSQCECRAYRNGQKNAVTSWILIGLDTIDHYLYRLIMKKGSIASQVTGEQDSAIKDEAYFDELADLVLQNSLNKK